MGLTLFPSYIAGETTEDHVQYILNYADDAINLEKNVISITHTPITDTLPYKKPQTSLLSVSSTPSKITAYLAHEMASNSEMMDITIYMDTPPLVPSEYETIYPTKEQLSELRLIQKDEIKNHQQSMIEYLESRCDYFT